VKLALRGQRNLDQGTEPIRDDAELHAVRRQARRVAWHIALSTIALTALYLLTTG
jgi:hypothetical protein